MESSPKVGLHQGKIFGKSLIPGSSRHNVQRQARKRIQPKIESAIKESICKESKTWQRTNLPRRFKARSRPVGCRRYKLGGGEDVRVCSKARTHNHQRELMGRFLHGAIGAEYLGAFAAAV